MVDCVLYQCQDCGKRIVYKERYDKFLKAPCPKCDNCAIEMVSDIPSSEIKSDTKAYDIIEDVCEYDAR